MTTTSLLSHKPPPLKPRNNPSAFLRTNCYGSIGRPSSGKRRSAVELLEESKAHYVKSEKVLDAKQELKNADHLHVRSPTLDTAMLRSPAPAIINGGGPFPFAMCLTCPPYPHQHFEHFDHYQLHHNAHNQHLSHGSFHQQQHHLPTPSGGAHQVSGGNSGPPSVESGGTASTGSTGGGGVTAITTLGRSSKQHPRSHHHHQHHSSSSYHNKSHRSSSTGSSSSRHLQENSSTIFIDPINTTSSILKTSTMGRTKRSTQPGGYATSKHFQTSHINKDSVLASLLPGMSFTLPAQSSLQKQSHHHHHFHHPHQILLLQQNGLASLTHSVNGTLPRIPATSSATSTVIATTTISSLPVTAANGLRSSGTIGTVPLVTDTISYEKRASIGGGATSNSALGPVVASKSTLSSTLNSTAQQHQHKQLSVGQSIHNPKAEGVGHFRERSVLEDSPPPLPPKSPRITSKPARPHDFPQQLQLQVVDSSLESASKSGNNSSSAVPPPPPRRHSNQTDSQAKYLRFLQEQSSNKLPNSIIDTTQSMTLPSPILPPTPPPDVVMESPMSDSGPIISPPPAFSTPVTPMVDRQNSTTSDKTGGVSIASQQYTANHNAGTGRLRSLSQSTSHYHNITGFSLAPSISATSGTGGSSTMQKHHTHPHKQQPQQQQQQQHHYHTPLSGTVSMSAISTVGGRDNSSRNNKSIPDLSLAGALLKYSPTSRSRSNSSPMSPEESVPASSPDDDEEEDADEDPTSSSVADNGHDGDDDSSDKVQSSSISPKLLATSGMARRNSTKSHLPSSQQPSSVVSLIPKSVTENSLYKVGTTTTGVTGAGLEKTSVPLQSRETPQQSKATNYAEALSPGRRPILRSKSDLSHRYAKAEKSATLTHGFTMVQVDISSPPPPPLPMHGSVTLTKDFSKNHALLTGGTLPASYGKTHHHHIYQTPNVGVVTSTSQTSHFHEPHNQHFSASKRATKSASDLERFFDMLGLENSPALAPILLSENKDDTRKKSGSESPVFFSSVSSVDSAPRRSGSADSEDSPLDDKLGSRTVGGYAKFGPAGGPSIMVQHGEPSIVERNARVIKWLFNCRKALERR